MSYKHGVYINEVPTSLIPPVPVESALPVVIGTAPVHNLPSNVNAPVNEPRIIYSVEDFIAQFGAVAEGEEQHDYTLAEFINVYIGRYNVAPVVVINVFDPATHANVAAVTSDDIIGGIQSDGSLSGIALIKRIFPLFRKVPCQLLAPSFSAVPSVAIALAGACVGINGHFTAMAIADLPDTITHPENAPAYVVDNNLTDKNLLLFFGSPYFNNQLESGSTHLAAVIAQRDAENDNIPFWSPSNKRLLCQGMKHGGAPLHLDAQEAANLNGNGIITALNMIGGLVAWGDQTAAYPGITDVKDVSIPVRRMFNWIGNQLVLTAWQRVSSPMRHRFINSMVDSFNIWLNGLTARECILGGRVTFELLENPMTDLMNGIARFHVSITPPTAAREISFTLEYDPHYLEQLYVEGAN